jgi:hypothetical protein
MMISSVVVIIGFVGIILSLLSNVLAFETNRRQYKSLHEQGTATHNLVNGQHTDMVARVDQLTDALQTADVVVPTNGKGGKEDAI